MRIAKAADAKDLTNVQSELKHCVTEVEAARREVDIRMSHFLKVRHARGQ